MSDVESTHRTMEHRLRGWTGAYAVVALDEQRSIDAETIRASIRRRWWIVLAGAVVLGGMAWFDLLAVETRTVRLILGGAVAANLSAWFMVRTGWYRWWFTYCLAVLDILIVAVFVALVGPGGAIAAFFVAILPYAFNEGRTVGDMLAFLAAAAYLGASVVHGTVVTEAYATWTDIPAVVYIETGVFLLVASALRRIPATLVARIRIARSVMQQAEHGALGVRAPAAFDDELGFLEKSFNRMLNQIAKTISAVQREADEVFVLADVLSQAAGGVLDSSEAVAGTSAELAQDMVEQTQLARGSQDQSTEAAAEAGSLRERAERVAADARKLASSAEKGRGSVERAGLTLLAIGQEVRSTAESVQELAGMSERISSFAQTISRIARQTHVLALNAAIEASHSEGTGEGFAAVAEQVRLLAGQAAKSAREVVDLIGDVQSHIDAVSIAMASGEEKVRDVGEVAGEAQSALDDLHGGVAQMTELVEATAAISRSQATRMEGLATRMAEVASISARSSQGAESAAQAMSRQKATIGDLNAVSGQLAALAERMRQSIAQFTVHHPDDATAEHRTPDSTG